MKHIALIVGLLSIACNAAPMPIEVAPVRVVAPVVHAPAVVATPEAEEVLYYGSVVGNEDQVSEDPFRDENAAPAGYYTCTGIPNGNACCPYTCKACLQRACTTRRDGDNYSWTAGCCPTWITAQNKYCGKAPCRTY